MKAFHGDPAIKEKYLARLKAHHAADEIIQGIGYNGSHGCAVGCTLNKYDHRAYENELGLPQWLAHLEDRIFESLPAVDAQLFAVDFLESIAVGADVENVRWYLAAQRHARDRNRLLQHTEPYAKKCIAALNIVIAYCESQAKTKSAAESSSRSAESAAESAAWSAAWSARLAARLAEARSAEAAEARSAARSAESAAESAAWSAARLAARSAEARSAEAAAESSSRSAESAAWAAARSAESAAWSSSRSAESAAESSSRSAESAAESAESAAWSARSAESAAESAARSAESAARSSWSNHFKWEAETLLALLRNAPQAAE